MMTQIQSIEKQDNVYYLYGLLTAILTVTLLRVYFIYIGLWPVNGDEAQYWDWSRHLAFGYYSKPPIVAWLIWLTRHLFGDGLLGLRLAAPFTHAITGLMCYLIGAHLYHRQVGFWAGMTYILLPGVSFSANIISTDPPLLMFWSIAFYCLVRALADHPLRWWLAMGAALGLAFLSKYTAIFFLISLFLYLLAAKEQRKLLLTPAPYLSVLVTFIILLPNMGWNVEHQFVSVAAVRNNADLHSIALHFAHVGNFIGAQFAIFGPILMVTLLFMLFNWRRAWQDKTQKLLLFFVAPLLVVMVFEALIARAHGNWAAPIYVTASIAVAALLVNYRQVYWLVVALILNLLFVGGIYYSKPLTRQFGIRMSVRTTQLNWRSIGAEIKRLFQQHPNALLLSDNRMLLTEAMYFAGIPLEHALKWDPTHAIRDQYDMVTCLQRKKGRDFIFVSYWPKRPDIFAHFKSATLLKIIHVPTLDGRGINVYVYYLHNFLGYTSTPYARSPNAR